MRASAFHAQLSPCQSALVGKDTGLPHTAREGIGGLPAWEGGHPGRHAGFQPTLLKEERDALHSSVICARAFHTKL